MTWPLICSFCVSERKQLMNYHISIVRCLLLLVSTATMAHSMVSIIKLIIVDRDDNTWSKQVPGVIDYIQQMEKFAPQVTYASSNKSSICDVIGRVDRAKHPSDFIVVVKKEGEPLIECDPEWGRYHFAFLTIDPKIIVDGKFEQKVKFISNETIPTLEIYKFKTPEEFMGHIKIKKSVSTEPRIPKEYKSAADRKERVSRRIYLAVISLLALSVVALLVIMFFTSLSHYNARVGAKNKNDSLHSKKKANDTVIGNGPGTGSERKQDSDSKKSSKRGKKSKKGDKDSHMDSVGTAELGPLMVEPTSDKSAKNIAGPAPPPPNNATVSLATTAHGPTPSVKSEKSEKQSDSSKKN